MNANGLIPRDGLVAATLGAAAVAVVALTAGCGNSKKVAPPPPPPIVFVADAVRQDLPMFVEIVGTLDGYVNADIRARVKGYLQTQNYKDGGLVTSGQTLFTVEDTDYKAAVAIARANVARAKAAQERARVELERDRNLFRSGMMSRQDVDNAAAGAADTSGQLDAARALLEQAELNLSYTQIKSPIGGVAGLALVRIGNLVGQDGPTLLTTVSQIDPIRVNFPMSEIDYVKFPSRLKRLEGRDLAWAQRQFALLESKGQTENGDDGVQLVLSDGSVYGRRGVVVSANRQVDASTGTIQIQALIPNPDGILRPGEYGRVRLRRLREGKNALVVPEKALIAVQGNYSLGIVGADNKVQLRRVELGPTAQGLRVIEKGLTEGEHVVVEGVQKISDGALVNPQPAPVPPPAPASTTTPPTTPPTTPAPAPAPGSAATPAPTPAATPTPAPTPAPTAAKP